MLSLIVSWRKFFSKYHSSSLSSLMMLSLFIKKQHSSIYYEWQQKLLLSWLMYKKRKTFSSIFLLLLCLFLIFLMSHQRVSNSLWHFFQKLIAFARSWFSMIWSTLLCDIKNSVISFFILFYCTMILEYLRNRRLYTIWQIF